jgi:hypothetical protein
VDTALRICVHRAAPAERGCLIIDEDEVLMNSTSSLGHALITGVRGRHCARCVRSGRWMHHHATGDFTAPLSQAGPPHAGREPAQGSAAPSVGPGARALATPAPSSPLLVSAPPLAALCILRVIFGSQGKPRPNEPCTVSVAQQGSSPVEARPGGHRLQGCKDCDSEVWVLDEPCSRAISPQSHPA